MRKATNGTPPKKDLGNTPGALVFAVVRDFKTDMFSSGIVMRIAMLFLTYSFSAFTGSTLAAYQDL